MTQRTLQVGTRGSALALWQTNWVIARLKEAAPQLDFAPCIIKTLGDQQPDVPLPAVGAQGVFVKELELALVDGRIDLAVHSMKDLPSRLHDGLCIGAVLEREDPRDAFISTQYGNLADLPDGARIGTGSFRRQAQLQALNPTWRFESLRGNLDTRLAKLEREGFDAIILAVAGLVRLGREEVIRQRIPTTACLPAVGQAAVGVEVREADHELREVLARLDHPTTHASVRAERAFLRAVQGGCLAPVGAHAFVTGDHLILEGVIAGMDGKSVRRTLEGPMAKPEVLGETLATELLSLGGRDLLAAARQ